MGAAVDPHRREAGRAADAAALDQEGPRRADQRQVTRSRRRFAFDAQRGGAVLDRLAVELRHARGGRAGPHAEAEDVQVRQAGLVDKVHRAPEHRVGLGREAGDEIGAERGVGPQPAHGVAERDGVGAAMAALHALEDHVVARLHGEVEMRHQPLLLRDGAHQFVVGFDAVDGGEAQPLYVGHELQDLAHEPAQRRRAWQVGAISGEIDARQHQLRIARFGQPPRLGDQRTHRHATGIAASERNDAEGAAVIAAVLHLRKARV